MRLKEACILKRHTALKKKSIEHFFFPSTTKWQNWQHIYMLVALTYSILYLPCAFQVQLVQLSHTCLNKSLRMLPYVPAKRVNRNFHVILCSDLHTRIELCTYIHIYHVNVYECGCIPYDGCIILI